MNVEIDMTRPTRNGFDPRWLECINQVLQDRGSEVRVKDLDPFMWDEFLGPMCDAIEEGEFCGFTLEDRDYGMYAVSPSEAQGSEAQGSPTMRDRQCGAVWGATEE